MNPKKIKGSYTLRADLSDVINGYTLTGSDRFVELSPTDDFMIGLSCADIDRPINNTVTLVTANKLFVKKARILTYGAPGLAPSIDAHLAAKVLLVGRVDNDITSDPMGGFSFGLSFFNEWQDLNIEFLAAQVEGVSNFYLSVDSQYTKFWIDDYNIQNDYIGETFKPVLEMIVDTAGVLDNGGIVV